MLSHFSDWIVHSNPFPDDETIPSDETSVWQDPCGPLSVSRVRSGLAKFYRLRLGNDIRVDVHEGMELVAGARREVTEATLNHFLADQVVPRVMADQGHFVLHAGAFATPEGAVMLMGATGRGKSTLAASFQNIGFHLLGDDAMVVSEVGRQPVVRAVYPSLRLFPDSVTALIKDPSSLEQVAHYTTKLRVNVPVGDTRTGSLPLRAIFDIGPCTRNDEIAVRRLSPSQSSMAVLSNTFSLDPTDKIKSLNRLKTCVEISDRIPIFEIAYPHEYSKLPNVHDAILKRLL